MNVFISWSGKMSGELAKVLRDWLPSVIQAAKPYFSTDDIEKGARGNTMLAKELEDASIGILCLTRENLEAPWIMFEAGALSKSLDKSRVCPILFGELSTTDLQGPLTNFQASKFSQEDMLKVLATINKQASDAALETKVLDNVFEKWWPELDQKVKEVMSKTPKDTSGKIRDDRELLEEILTLARQIPGRGRDTSIMPRHMDNKEFKVFVSAAKHILSFAPKSKLMNFLQCGLWLPGETSSKVLNRALFEMEQEKTQGVEALKEIKSEIKKLRKTGGTKK